MATIKSISNIEQTATLAKELAASLKGGEVLGLVGELGAGKTTLVQFLARELGVKEKVLSPTFVLMKIYSIKNSKSPIKNIVHVDAYRLNNSAELKNIGLPEYFNKKDTVVIIEWADKVKDLLPQDVIIINLREGSLEGERIIEINSKS